LTEVNIDNLEKRNKIETLQRDIEKFQSLTEEYRQRYDKSQIENNQHKNSIKSLQDDLNANRSAFTFELNSLERALEAALSGIPPKTEPGT
jgi:predicted  nucleic acid-binding Zn-ribbon protein